MFPYCLRVWLFVCLAGCATALLPAAAYGQPPRTLAPARVKSLKLAPQLQAADLPSTAAGYRVQVTDRAAFSDWARQHLAGVVLSPARGNTLLIRGKAPGLLQRLADCPWVTFVDVPNRTPAEERVLDRPDWTLNKVLAVHRYFPRLNGAGMAVSIKERPFDTGDIDFRGRVLGPAAAGPPLSDHATTIATLIAGGGNSAPDSRGVAWGAGLASSDFSDLLPDDGDTLQRRGISVQNHSYGVTIENYYGLETAAYDQHCRAYPALMHVFSAGNRGEEAVSGGPYAGLPGFSTLTGQFKQAKNTLCVGATDQVGERLPLSSQGPAYDGRIKPELVAYANGGTSEAAALVSGVCLLVQQAYGQHDGGRLPPASLVKAALLNSADDAGRPGVDFETGFGSVDALGAVRTIREKHFVTDSLADGQERETPVTVPSGCPALKITLVWNDPEARPNAPEALVNDLDLVLVHVASGRRYYPWVLNHFPHADSLRQPATRRADHLNNVEQVSVTQPPPGPYRVYVRGHRVTTARQAYSLAFTAEEGSAWTFPVAGSNLRPGAQNLIRWDWGGAAPTGRLEYRVIGHSGWLPVDPAVHPADGAYPWTPPALSGRAQLRLLAAGQTLLSDTFTVSVPPLFTVGLRCGDQLILNWQKLAGVAQYQLYRLGDAYLEPLLVTADTSFVVRDPSAAAGYYAVAPLLAGSPGARTFTTPKPDPQRDCYIALFALQALHGDSAELRLQLTSLHQLEAIQLEAWRGGGFHPVAFHQPVDGLSVRFTVTGLRPGISRYRARVVTTGQKAYYSRPLEIYYAPPQTVRLFPNPVLRGRPVGFVSGSRPSLWRLFNGAGVLLEEHPADSVGQIPTAHLRPGFYQVCVQFENGTQVCQGLVIQ